MSTVGEGKVVQFHYTLRGPAGDVIDSSDGGDPLTYLHGAQNIVSGLERQLEGRVVGDKLNAVVPARDGYGEKEGPGPQTVPRSAFPSDVELAPGMSFVAEGPGGEQIPLWIASIEDDKVMVDNNHPLAGVDLSFDVEIVSVRDASDEEKEHGHVHGPAGHHHHE